MPLADYSHWNEEATIVWWEEEGKHVDSEPDPDRYDDLDDYESTYEEWEEEDECETETNS